MIQNPSQSGPKFSGRKKSIVATGVVIALIVGYVLLQPVVERKLGIQLPNLLDTEPAVPEQAADEDRAEGWQADDRGPSSETDKRPEVPESASDGDEPAGGLRDIGGNIKLSPAGLRYGPGSFEGHRTKHVLRHAVDDPSRPVHGVFDGAENEIFSLIDEAYLIAQRGGPREDIKREGPRTIYTVDLQRRIGYIGGQSGRRSNHPPATRLRLVLEDINVITAYPLGP